MSKTIIACNKCGKKMRVPADRHIRLNCVNCKELIEVKNGVLFTPITIMDSEKPKNKDSNKTKGSHTFNKHRKRHEPNDSACRYCRQSQHSERMDDNYFATVFKEGDRTNLIVYSSVKFSKIKVGVSRCKKCLTIHKNSSTKAYFSTVALVLITGIIFYLIIDIYVLVYLVLVFPLIFVLPNSFTSYFVGQKNVLTKKEGAKREPLIRQMLREGWSLTKPLA